MKSLFQNNPLEGLMIFVKKENWKNTLLVIQNLRIDKPFFFFFDSERGSHLKLFANQFDETSINQIQAFLATLSQTEVEPQTEDILFKNVPENTIQRIQLISRVSDIFYEEGISDKKMETFLCQLSNVVIDALGYNDFFIQEKNRMNFAIQLIFMALVRTDKRQVAQSLNVLLGNNDESVEENLPLSNFYQEVQQIENEEEIEAWVLNWLAISEDFLQENSFQTLVESICMMLEIRTFSTQLLLIVQLVLKEEYKTAN
jgi:hypothetical protein